MFIVQSWGRILIFNSKFGCVNDFHPWGNIRMIEHFVNYFSFFFVFTRSFVIIGERETFNKNWTIK